MVSEDLATRCCSILIQHDQVLSKLAGEDIEDIRSHAATVHLASSRAVRELSAATPDENFNADQIGGLMHALQTIAVNTRSLSTITNVSTARRLRFEDTSVLFTRLRSTGAIDALVLFSASDVQDEMHKMIDWHNDEALDESYAPGAIVCVMACSGPYPDEATAMALVVSIVDAFDGERPGDAHAVENDLGWWVELTIPSGSEESVRQTRDVVVQKIQPMVEASGATTLIATSIPHGPFALEQTWTSAGEARRLMVPYGAIFIPVLVDEIEQVLREAAQDTEAYAVLSDTYLRSGPTSDPERFALLAGLDIVDEADVLGPLDDSFDEIDEAEAESELHQLTEITEQLLTEVIEPACADTATLILHLTGVGVEHHSARREADGSVLWSTARADIVQSLMGVVALHGVALMCRPLPDSDNPLETTEMRGWRFVVDDDEEFAIAELTSSEVFAVCSVDPLTGEPIPTQPGLKFIGA